MAFGLPTPPPGIPSGGPPSPPGLPGGHPPGPPGGTGAASIPGRMAGSGQSGVEKVRLGLKMLQEALGQLPVGSEIQVAVSEAAAKISKHVGQLAGSSDPMAMMQQLAQLARQSQQAPVPPALAGGGAPPPGGPPMGAPPGMGAGPPAMAA